MSFVAHAFALFLAQSSTPFERAERFLKSGEGFSSRITVSLQGLGSAKGTYEFLPATRQRLRLANASLDEEFLQNEDASVLFDHRAKMYTWYPPFPKAEEPPPEAHPLLRFGMPSHLVVPSLTKLAPRERWKGRGRETLAGIQTDMVAVPSHPGSAEPDDICLWVDAMGVIRKLRFVITVESRTMRCDVDFENPSRKPKPATDFALKVPWGFSPTSIVRRADAKVTSDTVSLTKLRSHPDGTLDDVTGRFVVLLTSNDMADETDTKAWERLAAEAKRAGLRFVQVWLGRQPPKTLPAWDVFWDADGRIEAQLGPPVTPYVMAVDGGNYVAGWQGWPGKNEALMLESLLKPFKKTSQ